MKKKLLTKELVENMYKEGTSIKNIGKELGYSDRTIKSFMIKNDIKIKTRNNDILSPEITKKIEIFYKNGLNSREIGEKLNLSTSKVKSYLITNGLWIKQDKISKEELVQMYLYEKLSIREIANKKNCSIKKVQLALDKNGIKKRTYIINPYELKLFRDLGISISEIANQLNTSRYFVEKAMVQYKII